MIKVVDFWFDIGVDGVRLDAVPYLYEREGTSCENLPETHAYLKALRQQVDEKHGDKMLLAEANQWPDDAVRYFGTGKGDECRMAFHFPLMPRLFMSLRMEDRVPMVGILQQTPAIPETAQWALFLRNHDELTLEMVTDEDRDYRHRMYTHLHKARLNLGNGQSQSMVLSARFWARWVSAIFFKAYLQAAGNAAFLPPAESALHMMTEVFLLRKTIYEPGCELSNRPDWVKIPRQGILELMSEENAAAFMTKGEINKAPK